MKKNTDLLKFETFYHVFNKGINGENIFLNEIDYQKFLNKYAIYIEPIANTYAYSLLGNHFHLLIKTKSEREIEENVKARFPEKVLKSANKYISSQFAHLFMPNRLIERLIGLAVFLNIHSKELKLPI